MFLMEMIRVGIKFSKLYREKLYDNTHLFNISKKKNGLFLHADKHQSLNKSILSFLVEAPRHIQSTQNRKLVMFLQYLKKKVSQLLLCSIVMQNIQIFYGGPVMSSVTRYHITFHDTTLKS